MKPMILAVLCAVGLSASMGWAKVKCLAETPSEPNYECELEEGHEGEHLDKLSDGMSVNWTKDMSVRAFEKLEAENEELKKKLELYKSTSTVRIISWPEFCNEYGHCYYPLKFGSHIHKQYIDDTEFIKGKGVDASVMSQYLDEMCKHCKKRRRKETEIKWIEEEQ